MSFDKMMKDPAFRRGFYMGFKGKTAVAEDDWEEELHPRDDDGKFTFGEGGGSGSSSGGETQTREESGGSSEKVTTRSEADTRLKSMFKEIKEDFKVNDEHAVSIANTLTKLDDEFGAIANSNVVLEGLNADEMEQGIRAGVGVNLTDFGEMHLAYSAKAFSEEPTDAYLASIKSDTDSGYHMPCDVDNKEELMSYVTTHEYGHMVQNSILKDKIANNKKIKEMKAEAEEYYDGQITPYMVYKMSSTIQGMRATHAREIMKIAEKNNPNFDLKSQISKYGRKNAGEFFAECFANSQLSKPNELGMAMREFLRKHKIGKSNQRAPKRKKKQEAGV